MSHGRKLLLLLHWLFLLHLLHLLLLLGINDAASGHARGLHVHDINGRGRGWFISLHALLEESSSGSDWFAHRSLLIAQLCHLVHHVLGSGGSKLFSFYRFGASQHIHLILVILLDFQGFVKLACDLAHDLIVDSLHTLLLSCACRLYHGLLEVALVGDKGTMLASDSVDIHRELILLLSTTQRIRGQTLGLVLHLMCLLKATALCDLLDVSSTHHRRFRRNLAWDRSLQNRLHLYGHLAWQGLRCRWGGKDVDLVSQTRQLGRRTVSSFNRDLRISDLKATFCVDFITLRRRRLGLSFLLISILSILRTFLEVL